MNIVTEIHVSNHCCLIKTVNSMQTIWSEIILRFFVASYSLTLINNDVDGSVISAFVWFFVINPSQLFTNYKLRISNTDICTYVRPESPGSVRLTPEFFYLLLSFQSCSMIRALVVRCQVHIGVFHNQIVISPIYIRLSLLLLLFFYIHFIVFTWPFSLHSTSLWFWRWYVKRTLCFLCTLLIKNFV